MPSPNKPILSVGPSGSDLDSDALPWWRLLNKYQWFVLVVAALGWLFDCFDQQIFTMSRSITMRDLLPQSDSLTQIKYRRLGDFDLHTGLGDRWRHLRQAGRQVGSGQDHGVDDHDLRGLYRPERPCLHLGYFALFRFLTGAGVGGEFAVGAALVAEVMPDRARPYALGLLQSLSALGNILAAYSLGVVVPENALGWGWRGLYYVGALPAVIAVFVLWRLREPERWVAAKAAALKAGTSHRFGRVSDLFSNPEWRRNTLVGLGLAVAGQIGLWGVGFYTPELIDSAIPTIELATRPKVEALLNAPSAQAHTAVLAALDEKEQRKFRDLLTRASAASATIDPLVPVTPEQSRNMRAILRKAITEDEKTQLKSRGGMLQQVAAFFGIYCFTMVAAAGDGGARSSSR